MINDENWLNHTANIEKPQKEDLYLVSYTVQGVHKKHISQAMIHFHPGHGWRNKITPCFIGDTPKSSDYAVKNMIGFKSIFGDYDEIQNQH